MNKMKAVIMTAVVAMALFAYPAFAGGDTASAQAKLKELGYDPGPVDGVIGKKTTDAVRSYQQKEGLSVTGKLDTQTLTKLGIPGTPTEANSAKLSPPSEAPVPAKEESVVQPRPEKPAAMLELVAKKGPSKLDSYLYTDIQRVQDWQKQCEKSRAKKLEQPLQFFASHIYNPAVLKGILGRPDRETIEELAGVYFDGKPAKGLCLWYGPWGFTYLGDVVDKAPLNSVIYVRPE
jgi:hypothetical protein